MSNNIVCGNDLKKLVTMNVKQLFDEEKRDEFLQGAVKRVRAKKGGEFPFAFGLLGSRGAVLVIDWRGEATTEKLVQNLRKQRPTKMIVGKASIKGPELELRVEQQKGTIKAKDVRGYLAKSGLPVRKAIVTGPNSNVKSKKPNEES